MILIDLKNLPYRQAWTEQERIHADVVAGGDEAIILVEHPPVITMGRRGETLGVTNLRASTEALEERGVEFVQTDRGGDITFHGPGQLVAYPIIRLIDHKLSVGGYVKALQNAIIATLAEFEIVASTDPSGVGVWVQGKDESGRMKDEPEFSSSFIPHPSSFPPSFPRKIAAIGVRVKRGVTLHGLALNVSTDLSFFNLIIPCGINDRGVTSMRQILGEKCPPMDDVKSALVRNLKVSLNF